MSHMVFPLQFLPRFSQRYFEIILHLCFVLFELGANKKKLKMCIQFQMENVDKSDFALLLGLNW